MASADRPAVSRILLITMSPVLSGEAPGVQVANVAQAFVDLGHDVDVIEPTAGGGTVEPATLLGFRPGFRLVTLSARVHRGQSYLHALRVARWVRRSTVDLIYSRNLRACLLPALRGTPTVLEAHSLHSFVSPQDRWALQRLLGASGFRGIVAISEGLASDLVAELDVPRDRLLVAHDAVRPTDAAPGEVAPGAVRIARSEGRLHVGYTGSLFAGRGVELLLDAVRRCPWMTLHLVGGPVAEAESIAASWVPDSSSGELVVHGPTTPARARRLQQEFDVLVAPFGRRVITDSGVDTSRWMSPMKVFEYMASGHPIVISDLPVLREVLRPEVDALMVPPEDPDALVAALERLRDDPALGERLAASALERVRAEFTWDIRARRILERFGA